MADDADLEKKCVLALSKAEEAQIRESFLLFDTDGGGTVDTKELGIAMAALGFQAACLSSIAPVYDWVVVFASCILCVFSIFTLAVSIWV
jgi:hypothetical protein